MSVQPRKRFGQHWLTCPEVLAQIVGSAQLQSGDRLLEIGPGLGVLTQALLKEPVTVVAVELDRDLCQKLVRRFGTRENFLLLMGDFLKLDLDSLLQDFPCFRPLNKVVANIPYNITSPILENLLGSIATPRSPHFDSIVLLMQREVAERLVALPNTKAYSALSVRIQYLAHCDWIGDVPRWAFKPAPQIDSAIVRLRPRTYHLPPCNSKVLGQLVQLGFASRRKMLRNNLKSFCTPEMLTEALQALNLCAEVRAEALSLEQWQALCNLLAP